MTFSNAPFDPIPSDLESQYEDHGRKATWFGSVWDDVLPITIGLLCALFIVYQGSPFWVLPVVVACCWGVWQLVRWFGRGWLFRVSAVGLCALVILALFFFVFGVDIDKLHNAIAAQDIPVVAVHGEGDTVHVSVNLPSWGSDRFRVLRAVVVAAHEHAGVKRTVEVEWGDLATTVIQMADIKQFMVGSITEAELVDCMINSVPGTPP